MSNNISAVIGLINNGKSFPAVSLVKSHPEIAATLSKLVQSRIPTLFGPDGHANNNNGNVSRGQFQDLSQEIIEKTEDSESIMQLFPDMELAAQILISSIISPKDMSSSEIIYSSPGTILNAEISAALISKIKDYSEKTYKIKPLLPKILREALFESGSYVIAVIPESSIDEIINGPTKASLENLTDYVNRDGDSTSFGILGDPRNTKEQKRNTAISLESFHEYKSNKPYNSKLMMPSNGKESPVPYFGVHVVDNPNILKFPKVFDKVKKQKIKSIFKNKNLSYAFENNKSKLTDSQIQSLIYKNKNVSMNTIVRVKTKDQAARNTVGKPLIIKLPSESVIPVHVPGNEQEHVGYFVLIDAEGNPVTKQSSSQYFNDLQSKITTQSNSMSSYLTQKAKNQSMGAGNLSVDQAAKLYSDIVENDLLERLRTGVYGNNVSLSKNQEVYRIMLARTLANQTTQLLYLPSELVTYFAYKYNKTGIGKSLHDDLRIINSLRAMMMFSRAMASLKNSIGRTEVKLKLDERDIDPNKTIETAIHEISKTRGQQYFPLGTNSPVELVDWIQKSGLEYTFEGHPKIPDMQIEFAEKGSSYNKPDTDLDDELKKRSIMGVGLSPETVDNGFNSEFATTVVSNNILLAKRVVQIQEHMSPQLTDHCRKVVRNDGSLVAELRAIIDENYDKIKNTEASKTEDTDITGDITKNKDQVIDYLLEDFICNFELNLPQPNSVTLENQMASFTIYSDALDKCIESWISADIINSSMSGSAADSVENVKAIVKAYFLRRWMADNNVMPELAELTTNDDDGNPVINLFDIQKNHVNGLVRSIVHLFKGIKEFGNASDKDMEKINNGAESEDSGSDDSSSDDESDDSSSEDDGMADMGGDESDDGAPEDDAESADDEEADDEPPVEE